MPVIASFDWADRRRRYNAVQTGSSNSPSLIGDDTCGAIFLWSGDLLLCLTQTL
jgi:hypothetical protein